MKTEHHVLNLINLVGNIKVSIEIDHNLFPAPIMIMMYEARSKKPSACREIYPRKGLFKFGKIIYVQYYAGGCGLTWWKTPHSPTGPWARNFAP